MRKNLLFFCSLAIIACGEKKMERKEIAVGAYPQTQKDSTVDDYFGTKVADPFRWLENDTATEVIDWVKKENEVTQNYLSQIPFREQIKSHLGKIWNYPRYGSPFKEGDFYFFYKNDGLQNQSVLYRQKGLS